MFGFRIFGFMAAAAFAIHGAQASAAVDGEFMADVAKRNPGIPVMALKGAYQAYKKHEEVFTNRDYMAIIDFNQPSNVKRMYIIDLRSGEVDRYYVAHGYGSGKGKYATRFSNVEGSGKSSLGIYRTFHANERAFNGEKGIYYGEHGRSLRVKGLQSTNSNAEVRLVVIHEAPYSRASRIRSEGQAGNSAGCFAVDPDAKDEIVDRLVGGALIYAYHNSLDKQADSK